MGWDAESLFGEDFAKSKKLKLKDHINNFEQIPENSISTAWEQFVKYSRSVPDHKITNNSIEEIFYRALYENCKVVAGTITKGPFLNCTFVEVAQRLERVAKTNRAWDTRESTTTKALSQSP